jgi:LPS-assembly protein
MHVRPRLLALAIALCFNASVEGAEPAAKGEPPAAKAEPPAAPGTVPAPDAGLRLPPLSSNTPPGDSALGLRLPAYITADRIEGTADKEVNATGNAEIRRGDVFIGADSLRYSSVTEEVEARGNVRIERDTDRISGAVLRYKTTTNTGEFENLQYSLSARRRQNGVEAVSGTGRGGAEHLLFEGEDHYRLKDATFTTCKPGSDGWYVKVADLDLDMTRDVGTARGATLYFLDYPILYAPWMSFSLNNERKSGVLPPHVGKTSQGGWETGIPYYFNIAPNFDLTLAGRYMEKRGGQLNSQLRYLQPNYAGEFRFEVLPEDKVLHTQRSAVTLNHTYNRDGNLVGGLNINKVSDDSYFRDLSSRINLTAQTNLVREGFLGYSGNWWGSGTYGATLRVQKFQTLQDPSSPVTTPYARTPQVVLNALRQDVLGADFNINGEYVDFAHPTQIIGRRFTAYPSLSLPLLSPGGFITPKIGLHATRYSLNRNPAGTTANLGRTIPIMSVDSGLVFERDTRLMGTAFVQTLEPRAYYLRVPFRDQDRIPLFDTAVADFNYAQIFSENSFVGGDRINDANQLTLALTSRLLSPGSGQEAVRATLGQRFYLTDQEVTLAPTDSPRSYKSSDWLAALSGRITPNWTAEGAMQHNPREHRSERVTLSARYQPDLYKILNLSYRYLRDQVTAMDVSGQWPLGGGLYGVARYNYSLRDRRAIETLGGLEYNGDCWVLRGVVQRFATATGQTTNTFFLQLELSGFSRIGSNPLEVLKRNIPGYARLNEAPSVNQTAGFFD